MISHAALTEEQQAAVEAVAVFTGGFTAHAFRAVVAGPFDDRATLDHRLDELTASGAVVSVHEGRFDLPPGLRAEAATAMAARPDEGEEVARDRHLAWAVAFALDGAAGLEGPEQVVWLDSLEADHDNLRAALAWATRHPGIEAALTLSGALGRFWEVRGHATEGRRWLRTVLELNPEASLAAKARVANSAGLLALREGDDRSAGEHYEESLAAHWEMGDRLGCAGVMHSLGNLAFRRWDLDEASRLFGESLDIGRDLHDDRVIGASLANLGAVADVRKDRAEARRLYEEALDVWRRDGDTFNAAAALANLTELAMAEGDDATARRLGEETLAARRMLGDDEGTRSVLLNLGRVAARQGDAAAAHAYRAEARALRKKGWWLDALRRRAPGS